MLTSNINPLVTYDISKQLRKQDKGLSQVYEYTIHDINVAISLGGEDSEHKDKGILYFPVYIIHQSKFVCRIGVLEIKEKDKDSILDEDGDIDLDKCDDILLYDFVTADYLKPYEYRGDSSEEDEDEEEEEEEEEEEDGDWINEFMGSMKYRIIDNEGGGDCFFATI